MDKDIDFSDIPELTSAELGAMQPVVPTVAKKQACTGAEKLNELLDGGAWAVIEEMAPIALQRIGIDASKPIDASSFQVANLTIAALALEVKRLRGLVEAAYREGLHDGYHVVEVPEDEDWERSRAREELTGNCWRGRSVSIKGEANDTARHNP